VSFVTTNNTGVILRDFIYIDEGNAEKVENGMINFDKLHLNGLQLYELHRYQQVREIFEEKFGHVPQH
jgi:hypothetical protein